MGIKLTEEQKEVIKALGQLDKVKVNAYAGTGKTTTIRACAEVFKGKKILVLAFNRSVVNELKEKLGSNCAVYTLHGLAYSLLQVDGSGNRFVRDRKVFLDELIDLFGEDHLTVRIYARVFEAFCNSEFTEVSEENLVKLLWRNYRLRRQALTHFGKSILDFSEKDLYEIAGKLADRIEYVFYAVGKGALPITHDYYLKLFQLRFEDYLNFFKDFYLLAVDEAQDVNGVQEHVLKHAPVPKKLAVGDKHQQIYSWRLAINSLTRLKDWEEKYLTVSFRFQNEQIVDYTNKFLKNWKGETNLMRFERTGRRTGKRAIISRTNSILVQELERITEEINFTRDIEDIFRTVRESERLMRYFFTGKESFLDGLPNYVKKLAVEFRERARGLEEFAFLFELAGEEDYAIGIIIAKNYDVELLYEKAKKLYDPNAKLVLTTAHSAKGLEFDEVVLTEDFKPLEKVVALKLERMLRINSEEEAREVVERIKSFDEKLSEVIDEINLYYVAWTRALYDVIGPGAINVARSFEKVFDGKLLFEEIRKLRKKEELMQTIWKEISKQREDDGIDWNKLDEEFDF
mgnify:CR=1 FL=1